MTKKKPVIKGYVYHQNHGKVSWDKLAWEQFLANYRHVKIEAIEGIDEDDKDYLISARGIVSNKIGHTEDWRQRNLIAECYGQHPTK